MLQLNCLVNTEFVWPVTMSKFEYIQPKHFIEHFVNIYICYVLNERILWDVIVVKITRLHIDIFPFLINSFCPSTSTFLCVISVQRFQLKNIIYFFYLYWKRRALSANWTCRRWFIFLMGFLFSCDFDTIVWCYLVHSLEYYFP